MEKTNWILEHLTIIQDWSKSGFYKGNIKFKNDVKMEFTLNLDQEKCSRLISIIQDEIIESAKKLGDLMVKSMPVALPPVVEVEQTKIEE